MLKVIIRSNTKIAVTQPRIVRLRSNLVQSFTMSQAIHCKCSRSKVKGQGHRVRGQGHIAKSCISSKTL